MVLTDLATAALMPKGGYTSCIKINGIPILPPLITESKRLEIQNYKRQAIEIEKCLNSQLHSFKNNTKLNHTTLEHFLSFGRDNSHVQALGISDISKKLPSQDYKTVVPLKRIKPVVNLSCNIFDVSEYNDKGVVIFKPCNQDDSNEKRKLTASTVELDLSEPNSSGDAQVEIPAQFSLHETLYCDKLSGNKNFSSSTIFDSLEVSKPKPRLIRSNSYTLESPSPVLLEHFKKQSEENPPRRSFDLGNCSRSPILVPPERNNDVSMKDSLNNMSSLVQNLAEKHFGEAYEQETAKINKNETFSLKSEVEEAEVELQEILNGMPENYAKDIMEFLDRHKKEQEMKFKSYDTFKERLFEQNVNLDAVIKIDTSKTENIQMHYQNMEFDPLSPSPRENLEEISNSSEIKSTSCESQVMGFTNSLNDTLNGFNTSTPLLIDFESDDCDNEPLIQFQLNSTFSQSDPLNVLRGINDYKRLTEDNKSLNCSRELFPDDPAKKERQLKEQWAATVLTSAARGFLVRRLKRTERVNNLIQTIQDTLVCAMSLHMESTENIRPPDVELHRRLIQQVSAACFEFYEIFFNLTTQEQMTLIALDRQRIKEKLKRPKSTSSLKIDSNNSTPKSQSFNNLRQKKTLTPSFAA